MDTTQEDTHKVTYIRYPVYGPPDGRLIGWVDNVAPDAVIPGYIVKRHPEDTEFDTVDSITVTTSEDVSVSDWVQKSVPFVNDALVSEIARSLDTEPTNGSDTANFIGGVEPCVAPVTPVTLGWWEYLTGSRQEGPLNATTPVQQAQSPVVPIDSVDTLQNDTQLDTAPSEDASEDSDTESDTEAEPEPEPKTDPEKSGGGCTIM